MTESILRKHNLSVTRQRKAILDLLVQAKHPMTIEDIRMQTKDIDVSTLYRALTLFVQKGIVYQTDFQRGVAYFEFQEHHHHHISCSACGKQKAVDLCVDLKDKVPEGFSLTHHVFELFGLCNDCS